MTVSKLAALYMFCAHYHSGQGSRGYRVMNSALLALERRGVALPLAGVWGRAIKAPEDSPLKAHYYALVREFGDYI